MGQGSEIYAQHDPCQQDNKVTITKDLQEFVKGFIHKYDHGGGAKWDIIRKNEARYLKQEQLHNREIEWESIQPTFIMNLESVLLDLYQKYAKIEIEDLVGAVSDVQFSYWRSALLDKPTISIFSGAICLCSCI